MKVLITAPVGEKVAAGLREGLKHLDYELTFQDETELTEGMENTDCEILVCYNPFKKMDFSRNDKLKAVIFVSAGIDQIPDYILNNEAIQIVNNNSTYSIPIAEWIIMCLLMGLKNYPAILDKQKNRNWVFERDILEVAGMRVLFLGSGQIATVAARRAKFMGAHVVGYRRTVQENPDFDEIVYDESIDEEFKRANAVVVCLPDTDATKQFVNAHRISLMRDDAILINISRGTVIEQEALVKALEGGKFRFVALDVVEEEPLPAESGLWDMDRLFLTTHTSWVSQHRPARLGKHILDHLLSFADTGKLLREVNRRSKY